MASGSGSGSSNAPSEGPTSPRHATTTQPTAVVDPPPAPTPPHRRRSITEMLGHTIPASSIMGSGGPGTGTTSQPAMEGGSGSGSGGVATATAATGGVIRQVERKRPLEAGEGYSSALRRHHAEQQQQQHPPPPPPQQQQQQEEQNLPPPPPPPPVPPAPAGNDRVCTICGRVFPTPRGLFGHLRSHPNRAWRGAFPPPVFDQDEFADVPGQANIQGGDNAGGQGNVGHAGIDINQPPAAEEPDPAPYLLPDLNNPPPPED